MIYGGSDAVFFMAFKDLRFFNCPLSDDIIN